VRMRNSALFAAPVNEWLDQVAPPVFSSDCPQRRVWVDRTIDDAQFIGFSVVHAFCAVGNATLLPSDWSKLA